MSLLKTRKKFRESTDTDMVIFFIMLLLHIIDDFVLQPVCLSNLKQKDWWDKAGAYKNKDGHYDKKKFELYKNDYKMALLIHSLSWSIMISLPFIVISLYDFITTGYFMRFTDCILVFMIALNTFIHYRTDDVKANLKRINLVKDQCIHIVQILVTFLSLYSVYFLYNFRQPNI